MTPERWQQVKGVLAAALECDDTRERATFLTETCGHDVDLLREVRSLLDQAPDQFDSVAETIGLTKPDPFAQTKAGRRIGAYELERELGRGGMGTVWLGRRADRQFEKLVAIKLLKRGTDTDEVLRRFESERQMLARLEHPNIATLFDGGTTDDGLPYFVMEYVAGSPVTDFCVARKLSIEERLRLFLKICTAVQFAHQNLIVHRDLKPANILITDEGEPKLLDFGIAKLIAPDENVLHVTMFDHQRLTPAYASPEQVSGASITTVSDIYALGALLYEILTGKNAHRFATSHPAPTELWRVVVQEEPLSPSAVTTDMSIKRRLRGDLDNIVLKTLRKEPARRYGGIGAFSEDIRRHLEDRPVHARKDTIGYQAAKFFKRNKLGVAAGAILLITLLAGIIATTLEARAALAQRAKAERRFNDVRKIANSFMFELHNAIKDIPGALAARQLVTQRALEYLDSLAHEAGNDLLLKSELATAYTKIGLVTFDVRQAIQGHKKAAALSEEIVNAAPSSVAYRKQLSDTYNNLSDVMKISANSTQAIDYARKSLAVIQSLTSEHPDDTDLEAALADRHLSLGIALSDAGAFQEALDVDLKAQEIEEKLVAAHPSDKEELRDLAGIYAAISNAYEDIGQSAAALKFTNQAMEISQKLFQQDPSSARNRRDMWAVYFRNGRQLAATGDSNGARENLTKATNLIEGLAAADPQDKGHRRWLAFTYFSLGDFSAATNETSKAFELYRKAIAISEELLKSDPDRAEARRDLIRMYEAVGVLQTNMGEPDGALEYFDKAIALAEASVNQDPHNARIRARLAQVSADMANCYRKLADGQSSTERVATLRKAHDCYQRSLKLWRELEAKGTLGPLDSAKPEQIAREIASCDALLR